MKPLHYAGVWLVALVVSAGVLGFLARSGHDSELRLSPFDEPVAAIGSSLFAYGLPAPDGLENGLLGDGRAYRKLAVALITEAQALRLLDYAIDSGAETILLEEHPFAFDLARYARAHADTTTPGKLANAILEQSRLAAQGINSVLGKKTKEIEFAPEPLKLDSRVPLPDLSLSYPLHLRGPNDPESLDRLISKARANRVEIILVAPPRSQAAIDYMGPEAVYRLHAHLTELADRLGLCLFMPTSAWPDDLFVDHAHLNRIGRGRFETELAAWWRERPCLPKL